MADPSAIAQPVVNLIENLIGDRRIGRDDLIAALEEIGSFANGWVETLREERNAEDPADG